MSEGAEKRDARIEVGASNVDSRSGRGELALGATDVRPVLNDVERHGGGDRRRYGGDGGGGRGVGGERPPAPAGPQTHGGDCVRGRGSRRRGGHAGGGWVSPACGGPRHDLSAH